MNAKQRVLARCGCQRVGCDRISLRRASLRRKIAPRRPGRAMKLIDLLPLWLVDVIVGAEPETDADRIREARRERLRKALPGLLPEDYGPLAPISREWYFGIRRWRCHEMVALLRDASCGKGPIVYRGSRWRLHRRRCPRGHLLLFRLRAMRRFQWVSES